MNPKDILEKYYHFAVVGVTPNQEKYGYKIFKRLLEKGISDLWCIPYLSKYR